MLIHLEGNFPCVQCLYEYNIELFSLVEARGEVFKMVDADIILIIRVIISLSTRFSKKLKICAIYISRKYFKSKTLK